MQERAGGVDRAGGEMAAVEQGDASVLPALEALPARVDEGFEQGGGGRYEGGGARDGPFQVVGEVVAEGGDGEGGGGGWTVRLKAAADACDVAGGVGDAEEELGDGGRGVGEGWFGVR